MNRASVTALLLLSALLCGGCGGARLSAAAFHAKGDRICRQIQRKTESINGPTTRSFNKGLRAVDAGIIRLRKLRPPASDATAYAQFVDRLSRTFARVREDEPRLLALQREFRAALPKRLSIYRGPLRRSRRYQALLRRESKLMQPLLVDAREAARDARALGLNECANGLG